MDEHVCYKCKIILNESNWLESRRKTSKNICNFCSNKVSKDWRDLHPERSKQLYQNWHIKNRKKVRIYSIKNNEKRKIGVYAHYCGGVPHCQCIDPDCWHWGKCPVDDTRILTIEHPNNDGKEHRRQVKGPIWSWLRTHNYPEGYKIFCMSCNCMKEYKRRRILSKMDSVSDS